MTTRQRRDRQRAVRARKPWADRHWPELWELDMIRRAVEEQWPLSPEARRSILARLQRITESSPSESHAVAAARALIAADAINAKREATETQASTQANVATLQTLRSLLTSTDAAALLAALPLSLPDAQRSPAHTDTPPSPTPDV